MKVRLESTRRFLGLRNQDRIFWSNLHLFRGRRSLSCGGLDDFQKRLNEIVLDKEEKARKKDTRDDKDRSLSKQFLLIVTDEPCLDEATLSGI